MFIFLKEDQIFIPYDVSPRINSFGWLLAYFQSLGKSDSCDSLTVSSWLFDCSSRSLLLFRLNLFILVSNRSSSLSKFLVMLDVFNSSNAIWIDSLTMSIFLLKTLYALLVVE